jgi:hypothetical protein
VWPVLTSQGAPLHTTEPGSLGAPPSGTGIPGGVDASVPPSEGGVVEPLLLPDPPPLLLVPPLLLLVPPLLLPLPPLLLPDPPLLLLPVPFLPASIGSTVLSPLPQCASAMGTPTTTGASQANQVPSCLIEHLPNNRVSVLRIEERGLAKVYLLSSKMR